MAIKEVDFSNKSHRSQEVVDLLRSCLEDAEKGNITSIAIAASMPDGGTFHETTEVIENQNVMIAALARLQHRLIENGEV